MLVTRTYLELTDPAQFRGGPDPAAFPDVALERVAHPEPALYRRCYRTVGEAFHWRDRWDWTDAQIRAHLGQPEISLHVASRNGTLAGWYELKREPATGAVEVGYFGIVGEQIGKGFGKHLLARAVRDAWEPGVRRVWLHTCTLDHPHALPNYRARGFVPYRVEVYAVDSTA